MAELFKNIYNQQFFDSFTSVVKSVASEFNTSSFTNAIYNEEWESKELKQRMRHITIVLKEHLTENFKHNVNTIIEIIQQLQQRGIKENSIEYMFFPDFIEVYGQDDYDTSVKAFELITQFTSCEFAVRPFIISHPIKMVEQMFLWSQHEHALVRRLATEGCRPRLPWAMALPALKKDPTPILSILKNLKDDESETVRRSVANNLNDISKDHPALVIQLAKQWKGKSKETDWVVKHACRTLLKQGLPEVMELFGFGSIAKIEITHFTIHTPKVKIGEELIFSFNLHNRSTAASKIRLEYGIYYQKANGSLSKKVFKISEKEYNSHSTTAVNRKQSFKRITTRTFHVGLHQVSLIVNGRELNKLDFHLIN